MLGTLVTLLFVAVCVLLFCAGYLASRSARKRREELDDG